MSINITLNGVSYPIPVTDEVGWGTSLDNFFIAIAAGCLQKTAGSFLLSAELDFGAAYGLKSLYYKSRTANPSTTGTFRLANTVDAIGWRNSTDDGDLLLKVDASNQLLFNGAPLATAPTFTASRAIVSDSFGVLAVSAATATEVGYLSGVTSAIQTQLGSKKTVATGNAYSFETTNVTGDMQETAVTPSRAVVTDANGLPIASATTAAELAFVSGVTSAIQTQLDAKIGSSNATIKLANGSTSLPSLAFSSSTGLGLSRTAADRMGISTAGMLRWEFTASGYLLASGLGNTFLATGDGAAATCAHTFSLELNSGMYRIGAGNLGFATLGVDVFNINSTRLQSAKPIYLPDGAVSAPALVFSSNTNAGLYRIGTDDIALATAGVKALEINSTQHVDVGNTKLTVGGFQVLPILQVIQVTTTGATTTSSTSFVATSLSASITPKFSTSKIMIMVSGDIANSVTFGTSYATIARNGTNLLTGSTGFASAVNPSGLGYPFPASATFYDSPATTSAVTYAVYVRASAGTAVWGSGINQVIHLLELAQ